MQIKQPFKIKPHSYFIDKFFKKLAEPQSVVEPLTNLCGGWYLETFKQVINKLSKNKSSPLPLYFGSVQNMESISKNKQLLRGVFKIFDSRGFNKIDASQLYSCCLVLSKGSYESYLKTVVDIFGFQNIGRINRNQFFFFIDSFYRALPKILILKSGEKEGNELNLRLDFKDINKFTEMLFAEDKAEIERNEIYEAMMRVSELNEFLKYVQKKCTFSAETSRNQAIELIKIEAEVRKCLIDMANEVQNEIEAKN